MTMRKRLARWFLAVAAAILVVVMIGLNIGWWFTSNQPRYMRGPMAGVEPGRGMGPGMGSGMGQGFGPGRMAQDAVPGQGQVGFGVQEGRRITLQWSIGAGIVGIVVAVAASALVAERITRSLRRLAESARSAGPGSGRFDLHTEDDEEVRHLAESLNRMTERLGAADQIRRNFFADVAHELRHPISLMRGRLEMMQDGLVPLTPEGLSSLHDEVIRLSRLVSDLQELSLADVGALSLNLQPSDLTELLTLLQENFEPVAAEKRIALQFRLSALPNQLSVDPIRIRQVVTNLLSNAIRHTPEGGEVRVEARSDGERVRIAVADSGPGIPEADLPHIFDRFYRADKSRARATGGTGLGLTIALSLARVHGGEIQAENLAEGGARFTLVLPITTGAAPASKLR